MKIIKDKPNDSNFLMLEGENSIIASGPNAVGVNKSGGVFLNGPVSFSSPVDSIKFGGVFRFNPVTASGLPSTMITPIPTFIIDLPIKGISNMSAMASMLSSMV